MLGRYTTGPVVAMAEHSRGAPACRPNGRLAMGVMPNPGLKLERIIRKAFALGKRRIRTELGQRHVQIAPD